MDGAWKLYLKQILITLEILKKLIKMLAILKILTYYLKKHLKMMY